MGSLCTLTADNGLADLKALCCLRSKGHAMLTCDNTALDSTVIYVRQEDRLTNLADGAVPAPTIRPCPGRCSRINQGERVSCNMSCATKDRSASKPR